MKTSFYERVPDTFSVLAADLIALNGSCDEFLLTRINVPANLRGKGHGSRLLKKVTDEADATSATLVLEVVPSGGLDRDQLIAWYERNGFERTLRNRVALTTSDQSAMICAVQMKRLPRN